MLNTYRELRKNKTGFALWELNLVMVMGQIIEINYNTKYHAIMSRPIGKHRWGFCKG